MTPHPIIRQIITRDCHAGASNRAVIAHVISRLKHGRATYKTLPRADRKELMRQCVEVHQENRQLYRAVVSGRLSNA